MGAPRWDFRLKIDKLFMFVRKKIERKMKFKAKFILIQNTHL